MININFNRYRKNLIDQTQNLSVNGLILKITRY